MKTLPPGCGALAHTKGRPARGPAGDRSAAREAEPPSDLVDPRRSGRVKCRRNRGWWASVLREQATS